MSDKRPSVTRVVKYIRKGVGISYTNVEYADSTSNSVAPTSGWKTTAPAWQNGHYIWQRVHIVYTDGTDGYSNPVCLSGGKGISKIEEYYLATSSASGVTTSTSGWTKAIQSVTAEKKYLWNYEVVTYTDGTNTVTTPVIIGTYGDKGVGISSITEHYLATSAASGVTRSTTGWTTSIQTVTNTKKYLWNYETVTYTDGSTADTDPVIIGVYGDTGVGISSVTEYYLATSAASGVTTSTSGWTTSIQTVTATKKYLWNYEVITYSNGTTSTTTPVIIGTYGDKGVGISSVTEYYLATSASSGVTRSTSGWTTSIQSVTATKKYLWNYETVNYTDGTTVNTDPVIIGVYGDKGDPGAQGKQGPALRIQDWNACTSNGTVDYFFYQGDVENLDEPYKDVVVYNGNYYSCIKTHSNKSYKPTNTTYWVLSDRVEMIATNVLLATYSLIKNLGAEAIEMKDNSGNVVFYAKNGTLTCKTGTFENVTVSGTVKGVTGTFKWLDCVDSSGNVVGRICASTSTYGGIAFESVDMIHQGTKDSRSLRFYSSDIWCRGAFGARQRTILLVYGSYGYYYTKGTDKAGQYVSFASATSSGGQTYYKIKCYGDSGDYSGYPVDEIVFKITSGTYRYLLDMADTQRVLLINANDSHNDVYIYVNGNQEQWHGGDVGEIIKLPTDFMSPVPGTNVLGRGLVEGPKRDNDWS
jgi:hypothetical protein